MSFQISEYCRVGIAHHFRHSNLLIKLNKKMEIPIQSRYCTKIIFFLLLFVYCGAAFAQEEMIIGKDINTLLYPVFFYRKYISKTIGSSCPMYPSCSAYSIEAFKKHGCIIGWIMTCDRLMRCGRDEIRLSSPVRINGEKRCYDPVSNNDFWW